MQIEFDPAKDGANLAKHGVSLLEANSFEWEDCITWQDERVVYSERRDCAIGYIENRLYFIVFTDRSDTRRIISLRKANKREETFYAST